MTNAARFEATKAESEIIALIAKRAMDLASKHGNVYWQVDAFMDIEACHCRGCALRLAELLAADDWNFVHDVFGISRCIDRNTGQLNYSCRPRFAEHARPS